MKVKKNGRDIPLSIFEQTKRNIMLHKSDTSQKNIFKKLNSNLYEMTKESIGWLFFQLSDYPDELLIELHNRELLCSTVVYDDGSSEFCLSTNNNYKKWLKDVVDSMCEFHYCTNKDGVYVSSDCKIDPSIDIAELVFGDAEGLGVLEKPEIGLNQIIWHPAQMSELMDDTMTYIDHMVYISSMEDIKSVCNILVNYFIEMKLKDGLSYNELALMCDWIQMRSLHDFQDTWFTFIYNDMGDSSFDLFDSKDDRLSYEALEELGVLKWDAELLKVDDICRYDISNLQISEHILLVMFPIVFSNVFRIKIREGLNYEV